MVWSLSKFLQDIQVEQSESSYSDGKLASNKDLDPVPQDSDKRKWEWPSYLGFWVAEAFSVSMYQIASLSISIGLSPGLAILALIVGHLIICIPCMFNAWVGAKTGLNFPIEMRYTFGVRGSYFAVFIRGCVALIWSGTQTYLCLKLVQALLTAIFPLFKNFKNALPESAHITSAELLCFFISVALQLPVLYLNVNQLRWLFLVKTIVMPIFGIVLFSWAVAGAKGFGPIFSQGNNITDGLPTIVVFFRAVINTLSSKATLALNLSDFTRYAKKPKQVLWPQFVGLVILVTLCGILGIVVTSATQVIYGVLTWDPVQVTTLWNNRAAQAFASICWIYATILTNVSANTVSFSYDLSLWFPRYINPRRGAYVCLLGGIICQPWQIQNNAGSFLSFLGGYTLFLAPPAAIMIVDYYILRKGHLDIPGLYKLYGPYYFYKGFNIPAFIAFVCGIAPNLPGLAWACGNNSIPKGAIYLYSVSYITGILVSGSVYYLLCTYVPKLWMSKLDEEQYSDEDFIEIDGIEPDSSKSSDSRLKEKEFSKITEKQIV